MSPPIRAHHLRHLLLGLALALPLGWLVAYLEMGSPLEDLGLSEAALIHPGAWVGLALVETAVLAVLAVVGGRWARGLFAGIGAVWMLLYGALLIFTGDFGRTLSRAVAWDGRSVLGLAGLIMGGVLVGSSLGWMARARRARTRSGAWWLLVAPGLLVGAVLFLAADSWWILSWSRPGHFGPEAWRLAVVIPLGALLGFAAGRWPAAGTLAGGLITAAGLVVTLVDPGNRSGEPLNSWEPGRLQSSLSETLCTTHDLSVGFAYCAAPGLARPLAWMWLGGFLLAAGLGGFAVRRVAGSPVATSGAMPAGAWAGQPTVGWAGQPTGGWSGQPTGATGQPTGGWSGQPTGAWAGQVAPPPPPAATPPQPAGSPWVRDVPGEPR